MEVATGFVQSNILHHGLQAPEESIYLPIKQYIERLKYEGNRNGMPPDMYARSVVDKVLQTRTGAEIWEGALSWRIGMFAKILPLWLLVSQLVAKDSRPLLLHPFAG